MTDLATAAKALLDAMEAEAKAKRSWDNASANFSNPKPEGEKYSKAMERTGVAIDTLRAALGSSVSGWQDIETAPESCRGEYPRYILFYNGCHVGVGFCYPSEDGDNGTLYVDESDAIITPEPTHWQPLPAPPAHQRAEAKNG